MVGNRVVDSTLQQVSELRKKLSQEEQGTFDLQYNNSSRNPQTALILGLVLGHLGIDRFYVGHTWLGILKLLTLGVVLIWTIIDWFIIKKAARRKNIEIAQEIHDSIVLSRVQ